MGLTAKDYLNIFSDIASFIMAVIAIWLTLQLYFKSKETESNTTTSLAEIKNQTGFLNTITNNLIDYITKYKDDFTMKVLQLALSQKSEPVSQIISEKVLNNDVKKSFIQYILKEFPEIDRIISWLYYRIDGKLKLSINYRNRTVTRYIDNEFSGEMKIDSFYDIFFKLQANQIISIIDIEPFNFEISKQYIIPIKELFKEQSRQQ